jgi:hypothetical protein
VHVFDVGPKLLYLALHPLHVERQNLCQLHAHAFHVSADHIADLPVQQLMRRRFSAPPLFSISLRLSLAFSANDHSSLALATFFHRPGFGRLSHLTADFYSLFAPAPFLRPIVSSAQLRANLHSPAAFRSSCSLLSPALGLNALYPHFPVFSHVGNLDPVAFLQRSS